MIANLEKKTAIQSEKLKVAFEMFDIVSLSAADSSFSGW